MRIALVLALLSTAAAAQDVVRLRNGRQISGTVQIDESDPNGFKIVRWDTGGTVYVTKNQVTEYEWTRLRTKPPDAQGDLIEGVRVITTTNRELVGVLVNATGAPVTPLPKAKEQLETTVRVKTRENATPASVPRSVVDVYEVIQIREAEAFSPLEMVDRRLLAVDPKDAAKLLEVAEFAKGLKLYDKTKEILQLAVTADPTKKDDVDAQIAQLDGLIKEQQAELKLAEITKLSEAGKFDEALAEADKFASEFGETAVGKKNADLVARLKKESEDYAKNKADVLAKKVPEAWRSQRSSLFYEYSKSKYKIVEARELVSRLDDEILDKLSKKFNSPPEDIAKAWEKRDKKERSVDMADGSWIYKGGQDGGMDYETGGGGGGDDPADDFARRFGGGNKKKPGNTPQEGVKLDTSDQWWSNASQTKRQEWLETEYALTSKYVKKEKEGEKNCSRCQKKGTLKSTRGGKQVDVICPVCHKTGVVVWVNYW